MNEEISHIAQWMELWTRAKNFGLSATFNAETFILIGPKEAGGIGRIGTYTTLADLRAGISDWVASQRQAGRRI